MVDEAVDTYSFRGNKMAIKTDGKLIQWCAGRLGGGFDRMNVAICLLNESMRTEASLT